MVNLKSLGQEELNEMSMVEAAYAIMSNEQKPYNFYDLLEKVAKAKGLSKTEVDERISFLYTDLNIDGRFLTLGDNKWGLKAWYPHEQSEEEITHSVKPKRRKSAEDNDDDLDVAEDLEEDEFEDLEDELDELADEEDQDDENDDDDDYSDKDDDDELVDFEDEEEEEED